MKSDIEFCSAITQIRDDMESEELAALEAEYAAMFVAIPIEIESDK